MYWDAVLKEVLNKDNSSTTFTLTNARASKTHRSVGLVRESKKPLMRPPAKKYFLGEKYPGIYFTEREAQTMEYLFQGSTTAEVASRLNLSRRTIEFYLKNMKAKLKCRLKTELISKTLVSDFQQNYAKGRSG